MSHIETRKVPTPRDRQLAHAKERESAVSTAVGTFSALLPDAAAILFSTVEMVHPAITLLTIAGRARASKNRKVPNINFTWGEKALLGAEDWFRGDKGMKRSLERWQAKQFQEIRREERASNFRQGVNKFMLAVGYPVEFIIPTVVAFEKVPHNPQDNWIQAIPEVFNYVTTSFPDNLVNHVNLLALGIGAGSVITAAIATAIQGRAEKNFKEILNDERIQVTENADTYYREHVVPRSGFERTIDNIKTAPGRIPKPWRRHK